MGSSGAWPKKARLITTNTNATENILQVSNNVNMRIFFGSGWIGWDCGVYKRGKNDGQMGTCR